MNVANSKCRELVRQRKEFLGSNLYAKWKGVRAYVVYSFGDHWPLMANIDGRWYYNVSRASQTTTKHYGQAHPHELGQEVSCEKMVALLAELDAVEAE